MAVALGDAAAGRVSPALTVGEDEAGGAVVAVAVADMGKAEDELCCCWAG